MKKIIGLVFIVSMCFMSCGISKQTIDPYKVNRMEHMYEPYVYDSISRPMKRHVYRIENEIKMINVINYE
jgi:hypothetical protein